MPNPITNFLKKDRLSPSYPQLPQVKATGESNIPGLYLVGDVAGRPLVKVCLNDGHDLGTRLAEKLNNEGSHSLKHDVIVVGTGIAGMAVSVRLKELGRNVLAIDSGNTLQTLRNFTKGKILLAEPAPVPLRGNIPFKEGDTKEVLRKFEESIENSNIDHKTHTTVSNVRREGDGFLVSTEHGDLAGKYVVIASGKAGNPRKAGVPGEIDNSEKIAFSLKDPEDFTGKSILIYGGGDVAAEAANALADTNNVTIAYRGDSFTRPAKRNIEAMRAKEAEGKLEIRLNTTISSIQKDRVTLRNSSDGQSEDIANDQVFEMLGSQPPLPFFKKIGIKMEGAWDARRWLTLAISTTIVYLVYAWKKGFWPFAHYGVGISHLHGIFKNPSFWYSGLYTLFILGFGLAAMKRWSNHWRDRHQIVRFSSLIIFQMISFLLIECIFAVFLPADTWWRAYAVNNPFPLLFDSFFSMSGVSLTDMKWIMVGLGALMTFVVIPLSVRWHGKRFCTWVCGCGGLAETFGDRWRHLSPKGTRSQRFEIQGTMVLLWAFISAAVILLVYNGNAAKSGAWHGAYALIVDFWLVAVIPVALYPIWGGKTWCRYWCPLAKYMQILSKWYGTLSISSNDHCIQCTQCSKYCQVGVDVMSFARNGASFSNKETSCIHCGICISVCPMDVLRFERSAKTSHTA